MTMAQPAPPLGNLPPPGAGAIPLPAFMAPQGGDNNKNLVTALFGKDIGCLRELSIADMSLLVALYRTPEPQLTAQVMAHAIEIQSGPRSFLTILPTTPGNDPIVKVITGLRQYVCSATEGPAATKNLSTTGPLCSWVACSNPSCQRSNLNRPTDLWPPGNLGMWHPQQLTCSIPTCPTPRPPTSSPLNRSFGQYGGPTSAILANSMDASIHGGGSTKGGLAMGLRTIGMHGTPAPGPI
jgi:hypothetical protein